MTFLIMETKCFENCKSLKNLDFSNLSLTDDDLKAIDFYLAQLKSFRILCK